MNVVELLQVLDAAPSPAVAKSGLNSESAISDVLVLVGEDALLRDRAVMALRRHFTDDAPAAFSQDTFNAQDTEPERIVQSVKTLPMLVPKKLVLVKGAEHFSAEALDCLLPLLEHPVPSTGLVLTASKLDGRSRFAKLAKRKACWIDVQTPRGRALVSFCVAEAKRRGHHLAASDASDLMDVLGADLIAIDDALERLSLYVGERAPITADTIETVVVQLPLATIWDLVDGVSMLDQRKSLKSLEALLRLREPPLRIVAMLARQFRLLARIKDALASGADAQTAAQVAGVPPFKASELASASRRLNGTRITFAFRELARLDAALKSSRSPAEVLIQQSVLRLAAAGSEARTS